jgi:hypothetical protein
LSTTTHNNLFDAVAFLAGRCDWAFHEDGVGYNKSDTGLGHFLAELPYGEWTATQRRAAWQMLRKYRRQLATGGIDYDAIPVPARPEDYYGDEASDSWVRDTAQDERRETEYARKQEVREAAERAQRVIDVTAAGLLTARSPYNAELVAVQRDIPSRRWDGSQNTFNPKAAGCLEAVKAMVEDYGFTVTDAAQKILDGATAKTLASHRVELAEDDWRYAGHRPFTLVFPKNFAISNRIKKAEGWEWNSERVCWAVKAIPENVPMLRELTEEHPFIWSEQAKARLLYLKSDADRIERATRELSAASRALDTDTVYEGVDYDRMGLVAGPLTLRGFQNAGVEYALKTRGTFIADDMGTGKTIQALIAAREADAFPAVVVVRASIKPKWRDEVKRWLPGRKVVVVEGKTPDIQVVDGADVIVVNYDILADWAGLAGKDAVKRKGQRDPDKPGLLCRIGVKCLVIDESHYVKTPESNRTRAALVLARQIRSDHGRDGLILNLTGTPVLNRPIELAAQLAVIGRLKDFGGYWGFAKRYCNPPEAPIWMGDYTFKPLGEVEVGDEVIGWAPHEERRSRFLARSRVEAVIRRHAPIVKVTMTSGRTIRCTADHRWLSANDAAEYFVEPKVGRKLCHVVDPVATNGSRAAAWLGGMYDGEGSGPVIAQSESHNEKVCRQIEYAFAEIGVEYTRTDDNKYVITGGRQGLATFAAAATPMRYRSMDRYLLTSRFRTPDEIVSIEPDGEGEVIALTTATGNYVAWGYASRNCNAGPWGYNGAMDVTGSSNEEELHDRLRASCYIRRTKAQVLTELPEKQIARLPVSIDNAAEYREAELNVVQWVRNQVDADLEFLTEIADLPEAEQKIRIAARKTEKAIRARAAEELVKLNALRRLAARGKLAAVKDWIEDFLESTETDGNGEKLVVFAHHRDIQGGIRDAFPGSLRIHADDDVEERNRNMRVFQTDPSKRLIVCSMEAAREGLDLYAASNALFVEFGWNVNIHRQAEDRIHRMGQTAGSCTIWQMYGEGTIDEDMQALIEAKRQVTEAVTDGKVAVEPIVGGSVATETMKRLKARHGG